jgi:recombination protein RecA
MKKAKEIKAEAQKHGYKIKLASEIKEAEKIRTGVFALDYILDGGIYQGEGGHRIEFFGKEGSGKTTFALYVIKQFQALNKKIMYLNAERSYDKMWAEIIGVDNKKVWTSEPESLEQAGDMLVEFIPQYDLIIVDSIPSLITQEELDGTLEENKYMASQAKVLSPLIRKVYSAIANSFTTIIFINQLREKVGQMYGNPIDTPGGRALKHYYNTRVEFKLGKAIEEDIAGEKEKVGYEIDIRCTKNKRGKPYRTAVVDFYLDGKIDNKKSLFYAGMKYGYILKEGNTYHYEKFKLVGRENFIAEFKDWDKLEAELWTKIK